MMESRADHLYAPPTTEGLISDSLSRFLNIHSISFGNMATIHRKSVYRLPLAKDLMAFGLIASLAT
jgi:hypothetical protein